MVEGVDKETKKDYLQATIESMVKNLQDKNLQEKKPRMPIWQVLNDPQVRAIAERRALVEEVREKASLGKYEQEQQQRLKEMQMSRQQRREQRVEEQQRVMEVRPGFLSRATNFFKERTGKVIEFLSQPIREVDRIRQVESQSLKEQAEILKTAGRKLTGNSGVLKGMARITFRFVGKLESLGRASNKAAENLSSTRSSTSGVSAPKPPGSI